VISLHKAAYLIHGNPIGIAGVLARLNPSETIYTAVMEHPENGRKYFCQVIHPPSSRSARFSYLAPDLIQNAEDYLPLIDFLCFQAGEMGALNVIAEIEEAHPLFETLRRAGFCVFSWEAIWRLPDERSAGGSSAQWCAPAAADLNSVRNLYQTLVPPLVQNAEPFVNGNTPRLLFKQKDDTLAYVESISGSAGTYLVPLIHPSVEDIGPLLSGLIPHFKENGKQLYVQVRSYQAWLSETLTELKAQPSPRFALMVKHLTVGQRNNLKPVQITRPDQRQADPAAPMLNNCTETGFFSEGLK